MDECLPPVIRDSRLFMLPFFKIWFKGSPDIGRIMNFKEEVANMSDEAFADIYRNTQGKSKDRPTDTNDATINEMLAHLKKNNYESLLDVGCGRGFWLDKVAEELPKLSLTGMDFFDDVPFNNAAYVSGNIEQMPFPDKSFDVVTCLHVIEHLKDLPKAIEEMKRVARKQIIIATPCQRYYFYTLDLHIHFFPNEYSVSSLFGLKDYECKKIDGDWLYIANI